MSETVASTDADVHVEIGQKRKRTRKVVPYETDSTTDDSDGNFNNVTVHAPNGGKTSRWHRPKREKTEGTSLAFITHIVVINNLRYKQVLNIISESLFYNILEVVLRKSSRIETMRKKAAQEQKSKVEIFRKISV